MNTWGIIPAAGQGSRMQPLAFSKELLPVGTRIENGAERSKAVSEYLVERMMQGGTDRICFVVSPGKSDLLEYYGRRLAGTACFVVQPEPRGLCDAIFAALPVIGPDDHVFVGLPDTVWFPEAGLGALPKDILSFLCFPVEKPEQFDAVVADEHGNVREVQVKQPAPDSHWVWGAFALPARVLRDLHAIWQEPGRGDEHLGTLVNAYLARGGRVRAVRAGTRYIDTGTPAGFRAAVAALAP